ncbi:ABC transporter permease DevC [cf. Phormidesmis sp. LEGE 11477]|uniref:ABC transporter permease DevC n=1 Tax=cf. Phormidesmis sp. LEGE 11477 TaxID=1828680 RepID=UPI001880304D|nr:ABC transporter permease DevC [cf. Phormidesmis sp. LEGE 11477]MBE9060620.1 FtsX-like permease family protein [cf. Phormidesmis sp. LEGE 11477]
MFGRFFRTTPLAWLQMSSRKARLLAAIAGIGFADFLMFFQLGVRDALFDSQVSPYTSLEGDIFLVNQLSDNLASVKTFPRNELYRAAGVRGVDAISPLYIGQAAWRNPDNRASRQIFVYGIDPQRPAFDAPEVTQQLDQLKLLNRALYDRGGLSQLGDVAGLLETNPQLSVQVNDLEIEIVGLFLLGSSFSAEGNIVTSDSTFLRLFPQRSAGEIDVGIIQVADKTTIADVQESLRSVLSDDLLVLTLEEFATRERLYWETGSAIGFTFGLGVVVGFLVGAVIVYQILYTEVADHLPEYATLKAIGYSDRYFIMLITQEAIMLAILGFLPGFLLASGLYSLFRSATLLPIGMKASRAMMVLFLTIVMCVGAGVVATRKLQAADPADIF